MPIEIKELHIKGIVRTEPERRNGEDGFVGKLSLEEEEKLTDKIVAYCLEQILEMQKEKMER